MHRLTQHAVAAGILMSIAGLAHGQTYHQTMGRPVVDKSFGMQVTRDGGTVHIGSTNINGVAEDLYIVKLKPDGNIEWDLVWGGTATYERGFNIRELSNGDFVAVGETSAVGAVFNVLVLRITSAGTPILAWALEGDLGSEDTVNAGFTPGEPDISLDVTPEDFAVVVGRKLLSNGRLAGQIAMLSPVTVPLFNRAFPTPAQQPFRDLTFTDIAVPQPFNNEVFISGTTITQLATGGAPDRDVYFMRYNPFAGAVLASTATGDKSQQGPVQEFGDGIDCFDPAESVIAGRTELIAGTPLDSTHLIRFNAAGVSGMNTALSLPDFGGIINHFASVHVAEDRTVLVGGSVVDAGLTPFSATMWRSDPTLANLWTEKYANRSRGEDTDSDFRFPNPYFNLTGRISSSANYGIGADDMYAVRADATGRTGCLEQRLFPAENKPELRTANVPVQTVPLEWISWQAPWFQNVTQRSVICEGRLCPADLNNDGMVDFADFLAFFNAYDINDIGADINNDGSVDFADFLFFFNLYDTGCM